MSDKRIYNILFHTHTISGIVISVLLYVIFFAGSFSFFRDEIVNWERNQTVKNTEAFDLDFDEALDTLNTTYNLNSRDIELSKHFIEQRIGVAFSAPKDTILNPNTKANRYSTLDTKTYAENSYDGDYTLGEFLYRLHFFAQMQPIGYMLAGFVAFFFLFAIITGVIVHWSKIVSNFYTFRPYAKLKTLWTDAHTALGVIGLPFQFVYAVTGAFFMIKAIIIAPTVFFLFNGDSAKFYDDLGYSHPEYKYSHTPLNKDFSLNYYVDKTEALWPNFDATQIHVFNYGDANMHVMIEGHLKYQDKYTAVGEAIYKVDTDTLIHKKDPNQSATYLDGVKNVMFRLHYGDYGGMTLKLVSFLLGIISCFVILSGVMIWGVARNKKTISEKKRRFNAWLVTIYLAICLSMYPITALSFIAVKINDHASKTFIYSFYFIGWLLLTLFYSIKKDNYFTNKNTLLLGSLLGFLIPITNGITTNNWIWSTYQSNQFQIFFIDVFWIALSSITLYVYFKLKSKPKA
ncbi:PepSY-associated TM helix domain-containing protein [Formosa agariphila KMM 3901]|uniref:PepSY-associated TM helix domain-containing protein n=1 Tax=Formosa agariphila (strain DSM 15362 / KCTC 12365 / LMG 23005 / KMM 3901 / M-2Alg 35-1) TaxID=1347342 RepID=T2KP53_FORAG|nr:PepSY-associated TM helix domain-containing protein [Formosa agariphila]CDF80248.1 PepSY-associated TM helix domain-containing protein [Formosa agariphila KMM 3901]